MKKKERTKKFKEGGKRGGNKTLEMHGKKHYHEIGKKGALKRWNKQLVEETDKVFPGLGEELDSDEEVV